MDWETFYSTFRTPDFIPGFEIQNRLGGGAFGEVYKARKPSIGKAYAIKFLKMEDGAKAEAIERELEQVRHFSALDHPNLVTIEDMGVVLEVPYLIMGYAGEQTLAKRLRRADLSAEEALSFFVQACRGVLALHDRRLVHFDLKPGNIFLHGDIARVGDYGLAKLMVEGRQTLSFGRGTPHYMAPEMLRGRADLRADIYSLGVILYESLTGRVPFDADSSGGIVYREDDTPPEFPAGFPAELREAVLGCLWIDPEQRFDSVAELLEAMGQTARRGDSISFEPGQLPPPRSSIAREARTPEAGHQVEPDAGQDKTPSPALSTARNELGQSASELRSTARELGRGAAQVALGVWDGLKTAREGPGDEVPSGAPPAPEVHEAASPARPTIPVPPQGSGFLGTLRTGLELSLKVFLAILRGTLSWVSHGYSTARGRVDTRGSSAAWRFFRLTVFFCFLVLLGGLIMLLIFMLLGEPLGF